MPPIFLKSLWTLQKGFIFAKVEKKRFSGPWNFFSSAKAAQIGPKYCQNRKKIVKIGVEIKVAPNTPNFSQDDSLDPPGPRSAHFVHPGGPPTLGFALAGPSQRHFQGRFLAILADF